MKSRYVLITVALLCTGFILFALYLQLFWMILPCPLCVLQRYAFIAVGLCAFAGLMTRRVRICAFLAFLVSAAGAGLAFYQLWVIAHPGIQCGRDPLEAAVNGLWPAKWFPALFRSESLCGDILEPIMGLTPPQWALGWFVVFAVVFFVMMRRG